MSVSFEGRKLAIDDREFEMELPIRKAIENDSGVIIVVFKELKGIEPILGRDDPRIDRNVVGVDFNGQIVWRIEQSKRANGREKDGAIEYMINPWLFLQTQPDGKVTVGDFEGMRYTVDPKTGELSDRSCTR